MDWIEFKKGRRKIIDFCTCPHILYSTQDLSPCFPCEGDSGDPLSSVCRSACLHVGALKFVSILSTPAWQGSGGFCFSDSCFMTSLNLLESGLTPNEEIDTVYNHVNFAIRDNSGQGLTRKGIIQSTQCSHNIFSYKCVPLGLICRSDWRAVGRPPLLNCPHCSYECLRVHNVSSFLLFSKASSVFQLNTNVPWEGSRRELLATASGCFLWFLSWDLEEILGKGPRRPWSASQCGLGLGHYNQQLVFNKHPCGNNDN